MAWFIVSKLGMTDLQVELIEIVEDLSFSWLCPDRGVLCLPGSARRSASMIGERRFPEGPTIKKIQSRSKFSISIKIFDLARKFQSRRLEFPAKNRAAVGGSLENFILARNFQSRSKSRIFLIFGPSGLALQTAMKMMIGGGGVICICRLHPQLCNLNGLIRTRSRNLLMWFAPGSLIL